MYTIIIIIQRSIVHSHVQHNYIYTWRISPDFPLLIPLAPLCSPVFPFVSPSTYLAPSSCDRNRPPPSQVACKLTPFAPPFTQLTHPSQIPRTPTAPRLTTTTSGIFRLLLHCKKGMEQFPCIYGMSQLHSCIEGNFPL
jgi:hypothetical protein